jgi:hypothetical protein
MKEGIALMNVDELLANPPSLHIRAGQLFSYGISEAVLRELGQRLPAGARTLETGAGVSTLFCALKGWQHIAIAPDEGLFERIRAWCGAHGTSAARLRLIAEPSERCLPSLQCEKLDGAIIDGRHGFAAPFIDWHYIEPLLKPGGLLVVDDTHIWTGGVLRDFLKQDPAWEFLRELDGRTALFRKLAEGSATREWRQQPYVLARSTEMSPARTALRLLLSGSWAELGRKVRKRLRGDRRHLRTT